MQNCGMAPHFVTWAEGLSTEAVSEDLFFGLHLILGKKNGLNLSEDFFFSLHPILSRKTDLVLGWKIFILVFIILKFLAPPLSKILRTLLLIAFGGWGFRPQTPVCDTFE